MNALKQIIDEAEAVLITAGAGMGVDSGLPDFRGNEGFWNAYPEAKKRGLSFSEMANPMWFERDPELAWAFYGHRLHLYRDTVPHEGFTKLLDYAQKKNGNYFVVTSNVDGQFQKAGFDEQKIWEVHGSIHHTQCTSDHCSGIASAKNLHVSVDMEQFRAEEPLPRCLTCNALLRPNILMFGDWGWESDRSDDQEMRFSLWIERVKREKRPLVVIELGAGEAVPTIRHLSQSVAALPNATLIRINPRDTWVPHGAHAIASGAKEGVAELLE